MSNRFSLACFALFGTASLSLAQAFQPVAFTAAPVQPSTAAWSTSADTTLPDAPDPTAQTAATQTTAGQPATDQPSKRVLFIIPNYRSVPVGARLPAQTVKQKFFTAAQDSIDPAAFVLAGLVAGESDARRSTPEFHGGAVAYGRYYWHALADQDVENLSVEFLVPALTHEDTRYYTLGRGKFSKRLEYSVTRILITRSDSGKETVNLGELVGAGIAAGASSRYYPASQRDAGSVLSAYALDLGIDAASYVLREFDSDLSRVLSRKGADAAKP